MPLQISEPSRSLERFFAPPGLAIEERQQRGYFALCFLIIAPVLAGYAVIDLIEGRVTEGAAALGLVTILAAVFVLIPRWRKVWALFRIACLLAIALLCYVISAGGGSGFAFLWSYAVPLIVFFLFGREEGTVWVLTFFAALCVLFFGDAGPHSYESAVSVNFMTTYCIVSVLAFGLEASRRRYYEELLAEKTAVEHALAQAKTLSGLLPICSSCKRVRDDRGYWNQIETFIRQHSEAEFSHSLCPDCRGEPAAGSVRGSRADSGR